MPIKIPNALPATETLLGENIFVITETRALTQDIRPLQIALLNLMPTKIVTETQFARLLGNTPLQVELTLLHTSTHEAKNVSPEHLLSFYKTFEDVKDERFDGLIITGAPVEHLKFEEVVVKPRLRAPADVEGGVDVRLRPFHDLAQFVPVLHFLKLEVFHRRAGDDEMCIRDSVYIIHYLLLRGWKDVLPEQGFRTVIFDEMQELRRNGTGKYSAASLLSQACENVIGLSGTPIYNQGGEIWNVINILDFHCLGDWESFSREWCYGYNSAVVAKPELLGEHLRREGLMLRRVKRDVLKELAPKRRLVQEIDWDDKVYRELMAPVAEQLRLLRATDDPSRRALIEDAICQRQRQATGVAKAPFVAAFVRALVEAGEKVLLMGHHHAVMDIYKKELKALRPGFITGRETDKQKEKAADDFMQGKTDLLCLSLRSASGLNLQRATCVVFGELDWSPAVHSQAEDRAHRIGQEDSLLCYYLVSPKGSDREMQDALGLKVSQFVSLMGDRKQTQEERLFVESQARERIRHLVERLQTEEDGDG